MVEENHSDLEIKSEQASYRIPAQQINMDAILRQVGTSVDPKDIIIQVEIASSTMENLKFAEDAAQNSNIILPKQDVYTYQVYV